MECCKIAIVGGGIWGLSTAYHLATMGIGPDVVLFERNVALATETTRQSAGQVGQLRGDPVLSRAVGYTLDLLDGFAARTGHDPGFVRSGSIHLALTPERATQFSQLVRLAAENGCLANLLDPPTLKARLPDIDVERVVAAVHVPSDGYVDAGRCALAFASAAQDRGVNLHCGSEVRQIEAKGRGPIRLTTHDGEIQAEKLVVAAGPWTGQIAARMGVDVGMHPIRLQQARTVPADVPESHPVLRVPDKSCYVRPEAGGYLFGFFDPHPLPLDLDEQAESFRTTDVRPEPSLIDEAVARLQKLMPKLGGLPIESYRQGMMTCTPDGRFVIGPILQDERIWIATGCGGTGIAAAGAVGRWIASGLMITDRSQDIVRYAVDRFGPRVSDRQWLRERACATSAAYYRIPSPIRSPDNIKPN